MKIFILNGDKEQGPYTPEQVEDLFKQGAINGENLYCTEGMTEWRKVSELVFLAREAKKLPPKLKKQTSWVDRWGKKLLVVLIFPGLALIAAGFRFIAPFTLKIFRWLKDQIASFGWRKSGNAPINFTGPASETIQAMAVRVHRLEQQNRFLFGGLALSLILAIFMRHGGSQAVAPVTDGRELALRDSSGNIRWKVAFGNNDSVVESFFNSAGKERVFFGIDDERTARLRLFDDHGARRVGAYAMGTRSDSQSELAGIGILAPAGPDGKQGAGLTLDSDQTTPAQLQIFDNTGQTRFAARAIANGFAGTTICDAAGNCRIADGTDDKGNAMRNVYDTSQRLRSAVASYTDGSCRSMLFDSREQDRLDLATFSDGTASQSVFDSRGNSQFSFQVDPQGTPSHQINESGKEFIQGVGEKVLEAGATELIKRALSSPTDTQPTEN